MRPSERDLVFDLGFTEANVFFPGPRPLQYTCMCEMSEELHHASPFIQAATPTTVVKWNGSVHGLVSIGVTSVHHLRLIPYVVWRECVIPCLDTQS